MLVDVALDRMVIADLQRERSLLGDPDLSATLTRRIRLGLDLVAWGSTVDVEWRPISTKAERISIDLSESIELELEAACAEVGFDRGTLISTFAAIDDCRPDEIVLLDALARGAKPTFQRDTYIRTEAGRGHIYKASFDLAGYQLAFIRLAGQHILTRNEVLSEALLALAREMTLEGVIAGQHVGHEAMALAEKMVSYSSRWSDRRHQRG